MSSCLITCLYDLHGREPEYFHRSVEEYASLLTYHKQFNLPVYCFTEEKLVHLIPDFIETIVIPYDELPAKPYVNLTGKGVKDVMKSGAVHPGHILYATVINSKIFFSSMISKLHPEYETLIWLDSGIGHVDPCEHHRALESMEDIINDSKSRICVINYPVYVNLDYNLYNIASGLYSLKKHDLDTILNTYIDKLLEVKNKGYVCLEEQIWTLVYLSTPHMFSIRFTDYRPISNNKYISVYTDRDVILENVKVLSGTMRDDLVQHFINSISLGYLVIGEKELLERLIKYYEMTGNKQIGRVLFNINKFKNCTNNTTYKGRLDIKGIIRDHGVKFSDQVEYNTYTEYITAHPDDLPLFRKLI